MKTILPPLHPTGPFELDLLPFFSFELAILCQLLTPDYGLSL